MWMLLYFVSLCTTKESSLNIKSKYALLSLNFNLRASRCISIWVLISYHGIKCNRSEWLLNRFTRKQSAISFNGYYLIHYDNLQATQTLYDRTDAWRARRNWSLTNRRLELRLKGELKQFTQAIIYSRIRDKRQCNYEARIIIESQNIDIQEFRLLSRSLQ